MTKKNNNEYSQSLVININKDDELEDIIEVLKDTIKTLQKNSIKKYTFNDEPQRIYIMNNKDMKAPKMKCKVCGKLLPATTEYFYASPSTFIGLTGKCKDCHNKQTTKAKNKAIEKQNEMFKAIQDRRIKEETKTKICSKCGEEKLYKDFHNSKKTKDGKDNTCKECIKKQKKEREIKSIRGEK